MEKKAFVIKLKNGYSVLHESGIYFFQDETDVKRHIQQIQSRKKPEIDIPKKQRERLAKVIIFLSSDCNLRCIYCYASSGEKHAVVSLDKAEKLIDFVASKCNRLIIDFHGGGEPLLHFDIIKKLYEYAEKTGKLYRSVLISNGVIEKNKYEILDWIIEHINNMAISCDGIPIMQNRNRPKANKMDSSDNVEDTIKYLVNHNYNFTVRSTITADSVKYLLDTTKYFCNLNIKHIVYAPCYNFGRSDDKKLVPQPEEYVEEYMKCIDYACKHHVRLTSNSFRYPGYHYCGALYGFNIAITPDNYISTCYEVTQKSNTVSDCFLVGDIKGDAPIFYKNKLAKLTELENYNTTTCDKCLYQLVCRGGCPVKRLRNSKASLYNLCSITRKLVPRILEYMYEHPNYCDFILKDVEAHKEEV